MTEMHANLKSPTRYDEAKKADRIRKESRTRKLNFDTDNQVPIFYSKITVFKEVHNSGLYYVCVFVIGASVEGQWAYLIVSLSVIFDDVFRIVSSFDGNFYICKTCPKKSNKTCIPCWALCNMINVCELPEEF